MRAGVGSLHGEEADASRLGAKLPGERASTVKVASFVNSLPRWILKTRGSFSNFVRSMLLMPEKSERPSTSTFKLPIWPMPVPYPEVFKQGGHLRGPLSWLKRLVSLQVMILDWLFLGQSPKAPVEVRVGSRLSAGQWKVVNTLMHLNVDGNTPNSVDAGTMGRAASKFERSEDLLAALSRAASTLQEGDQHYLIPNLTKPEKLFSGCLRCGFLQGRLPGSGSCTAKPLVASRLNFPGPPKFDPCPYFDDQTRLRYEKPLQTAQDYRTYDGEVPAVKVFADRSNLVELYKKLADSGRLRPIHSSLKRGNFVSGLFAVGKDMERDRLILDGRPPNLLEPGQAKWVQTMASPAAVCMMHLPEERVLLCSGEDLRDCFYQFAVNDERSARNILSDPLNALEAKYVFGSDYEPVEEMTFVGLSSLAMGDCLACEYAQGSHTGLLLQHQVALSSQLLSLHNPPPRGLFHVGIIIDDLVVMEQCLRQDLESIQDGGLVSTGASACELARKAYATAGLEINPKKGFVNSQTASFWGIEVDGVKGLVRSSSSRMWPAMMVTLRVATLGLATVGLLECLAGTWVALLGLRRRLFSLLDIIFEPLALGDQSQVIRLSAELVDELVSIVVMAPLAVVNLRAGFADFLSATDASLDGIAAVRGAISASLAEELCRHSLRKSSWSTLLPPHKSWQKSHGILDPSDEVEGEAYQVHPLWEVCARAVKYKVAWSSLVDSCSHINVLEMKAYLKEEKYLCSKLRSKRVPSALDSQVVLGALVKGRSSSLVLSRMMRQSMCYPIGNDLYNFFMFYPSWMNRADGPSRRSDPADPDLELPPWWPEALAGDFRRMDLWLDSVGGLRATRDIPYEQLMGAAEVDLRPALGRKMSQKRRREMRQAEIDRGSLVTDAALYPGQTRSENGTWVEDAVKARGTENEATLLQDAGGAIDARGTVSTAKVLQDAGGAITAGGTVETATLLQDAGDAISATGLPRMESDAGEEVGPCEARSKTGDPAAEIAQLLQAIPRSQFFPAKGPLDFSKAGGLDLFSGCCGVAKQLVKFGCPWVLTFDIKRGESEDLLDKKNQKLIFTLLKLGAFRSAGMAPVCASFSRAVTPAVRSRRFPRGLPVMSLNMKLKVRIGNALADLCREVWSFCLENFIAFFCENPDGSFMWALRGWERFASAQSGEVFRLSFCRFGTRWRKNTRVATNTALCGLRMLCSCGSRPHQRLRGYSRIHRCQWTKIAEPYPRGVSLLLAKALAVHAGWLHRDRLNIGGCAKCSSMRIGEAANPGPMRNRRNRNDLRETLEGMPLLLPATLALEKKLLDEFLLWCRSEIRSSDLYELFSKVPLVLAELLRTYGDLMFQRSGALSNLRHLLLAAQRWSPGVKPFMSGPWELVARWEKQQPVKHRTPVPEAVVKALCVLAWMHGWYTWAAATACTFYGGGRVGEILKCTREDLLLPQDLAEDGRFPVFLRLRHFKSKNRTPASVQHLKISDEVTCKLLARVFQNFDRSSYLFDSNPYQYRKRWDLLIGSLEIPSEASLTPGGLRGGFAVMSYRLGIPIQNIMWSMRLRSQVTLESYLQEAASLNALASMPLSSRNSIAVSARFFPFLPSGCG